MSLKDYLLLLITVVLVLNSIYLEFKLFKSNYELSISKRRYKSLREQFDNLVGVSLNRTEIKLEDILKKWRSK